MKWITKNDRYVNFGNHVFNRKDNSCVATAIDERWAKKIIKLLNKPSEITREYGQHFCDFITGESFTFRGGKMFDYVPPKAQLE